MQEEVNEKTIALSIKTGKLTSDVLRAAMRKFLAEHEKHSQKSKMRKAQSKQESKQTKTGYVSNHSKGKQTIKELMAQNSQLTNIEITDANIKSFERIARRYSIDYSLKKEAGKELPKYIIFFKAKDVDVMTAAFKDYSMEALKKVEKPSLRKRLSKALEKVKNHKEKTREKEKDRGQSL